tara:strand:- start:506 stop:835 length:330 start_codon:yes stop_codon:yes gene_type:complete
MTFYRSIETYHSSSSRSESGISSTFFIDSYLLTHTDSVLLPAAYIANIVSSGVSTGYLNEESYPLSLGKFGYLFKFFALNGNSFGFLSIPTCWSFFVVINVSNLSECAI